jgi:hypothetical protein
VFGVNGEGLGNALAYDLDCRSRLKIRIGWLTFTHITTAIKVWKVS